MVREAAGEFGGQARGPGFVVVDADAERQRVTEAQDAERGLPVALWSRRDAVAAIVGMEAPRSSESAAFGDAAIEARAVAPEQILVGRQHGSSEPGRTQRGSGQAIARGVGLFAERDPRLPLGHAEGRGRKGAQGGQGVDAASARDGLRYFGQAGSPVAR